MMSRTWKWIIGIGLSLGILVLAAGSVFMRFGMRAMPYLKQGMGTGGQFPGRMHNFGFMGGAPGMMGFSNVLLPILVIALMLFIGYLVGSARKPAIPAAVVSAPVDKTAEFKPCSQCGKGLENGWTHCPYCGTQIPG